jgi:hypothetical protein
MPIALGYFDESTDEDTHGQCYVVAGFMANNHSTAILELRWSTLLTKYNLQYFKASELNAGKGQFQQYRDDPDQLKFKPFSQREKDKFAEIKKAFTDAIMGVRGLSGIGAALILPDYERLRQEYPIARTALPCPYFLCANCVLMATGLEICRANKKRSREDEITIRPAFDSHEEYGGRMKHGFDFFCQKNPISSQFIRPPHYEDDTRYLTLQAADDLAFEIRKLATTGNMRIPLDRLDKSDALLKVYKLDYESLKVIADNQGHDFDLLTPINYGLDDIL